MQLHPEPYPDNNPKTAIGVTKLPLHLVPPSATHYLAMAFADGAKKYGPYNWRDRTVSSSVYVAAAKRHIDAWWDGEDLSSDAKIHHIAHAMACMAIILDALTIDKLNDDRPTAGAAAKLQADYAGQENEMTKVKEAKIWIDVPSGWMYGFPKLYDPTEDGDLLEWIYNSGYPRDEEVHYTRSWYDK